MITLADDQFYVSAEANRRVTVMLPRDMVADGEELLACVSLGMTAEQAKALGAAISQAAEIAQ